MALDCPVKQASGRQGGADAQGDRWGHLDAQRPLRLLLLATLPMMSSGIIAAAATVLLISFDEVVVSLFVVGPRLTTLPVALHHYVESHADPLVAAVS
jgi:ABC-type spermidine/putrescine transport system permease subunit II